MPFMVCPIYADLMSLHVEYVKKTRVWPVSQKMTHGGEGASKALREAVVVDRVRWRCRKVKVTTEKDVLDPSSLKIVEQIAQPVWCDPWENLSRRARRCQAHRRQKVYQDLTHPYLHT